MSAGCSYQTRNERDRERSKWQCFFGNRGALNRKEISLYFIRFTVILVGRSAVVSNAADIIKQKESERSFATNSSRYPNEQFSLEGSRASPLCFSGKSKMCMR
jgi:hypothetical protein